MVYKSKFADCSIPDASIPDFVFESNPIKGHENVPSFIDGISGREVTFATQRQYMERFAAALAGPAQFGFGWKPVKEGTVVGVFSPNHVLYPTVLWGTLRAGGTVSPSNHVYTVDELVHQLKDSGSSILVTHPSVLPVALEAAKQVGISTSSIIVFDADDKTKALNLPTVDQLLAAGEKVPALPKLSFKPGEAAKRVAFLCYSSGTTGRSKGVMISHKNVVSNVCQFRAFDGDSLKPGVDKLIGQLPMYHIYGLILLVHIATYSKVTTVVLPRFELPLFLDTVDKFKITTLHLVPPIIVALAKHPLVDQYSLATVKDIFSGAAPLGKEVGDELVERLVKLRKGAEKPVLRQGWGMTETSTVVTANPLTRVKDGSVGMLLPNLQARLVDPDTGKDVGVGEDGEIWVKGPNIVLGYLNNPKANEETFDAEGYIHTGDVARVDNDGFFYIVDRIKELIKVKGLQVAPAELEALLLTHPIVADAAVIPINDERAGELPRAVLVAKTPFVSEADKQKATQEVSKFVEGKLARHKWLAGGIEWVDAIPKSPSGKILRRLLRDAQREKLQAKL